MLWLGTVPVLQIHNRKKKNPKIIRLYNYKKTTLHTDKHKVTSSYCTNTQVAIVLVLSALHLCTNTQKGNGTHSETHMHKQGTRAEGHSSHTMRRRVPNTAGWDYTGRRINNFNTSDYREIVHAVYAAENQFVIEAISHHDFKKLQFDLCRCTIFFHHKTQWGFFFFFLQQLTCVRWNKVWIYGSTVDGADEMWLIMMSPLCSCDFAHQWLIQPIQCRERILIILTKKSFILLMTEHF